MSEKHTKNKLKQFTYVEDLANFFQTNIYLPDVRTYEDIFTNKTK